MKFIFSKILISTYFRWKIYSQGKLYELKKSISALVNKYKDFCQTFSLTEIIKEPTQIKCSTSSLLDKILINFSEKYFPKRVTDVEISIHQLIYCTRKIERIKQTCIIKSRFDL